MRGQPASALGWLGLERLVFQFFPDPLSQVTDQKAAGRHLGPGTLVEMQVARSHGV